jgi:intracellular sulfur oxidation DsrE/DsrF family protein
MIARYLLTGILVLPMCTGFAAEERVSRAVQTPYGEQKVVFDFYFDDPAKINSALYWIRSLINPLMDEPYGIAPEFLDIKVVIHGTEIVSVARKNYAQYEDAVERMRYYSSLGVEFKVCGLAAHDYGYATDDFHEFIEVVPSAITELAHWQLQGHALLTPVVMEKRYTIDEIR